MLDAGVERVFHLLAPRIGEDAASSERARTKLHAALEPADDPSVGEGACRLVDEIVFTERCAVVATACELRGDLAIGRFGAVVDVPHPITARLIEELVPYAERGTDRCARVVRGRLDVDVLE